MIEHIFPGAPLSTQHIYGFSNRGLYMRRVGIEMKQSYQWQLKSKQPRIFFKGDINVRIDIYFKDYRKRDVDNFNKLILDSCNGIIWKDDSQIMEFTVRKFIDKINPRVELFVHEHHLQSEESGKER